MITDLAYYICLPARQNVALTNSTAYWMTSQLSIIPRMVSNYYSVVHLEFSSCKHLKLIFDLIGALPSSMHLGIFLIYLFGHIPLKSSGTVLLLIVIINSCAQNSCHHQTPPDLDNQSIEIRESCVNDQRLNRILITCNMWGRLRKRK